MNQGGDPMMPYPVAIARDSYRTATEDRGSIRFVGPQVLIAVADGVGGMAGGAAAAELAVLTVMARGPFLDPAALVTLLMEADRRIYDEPGAGETTIVVAVASPQGIVGASVGDSAAWLVTADGCVDLTRNQQVAPALGSAAAAPVPFVHRRPGGTLVIGTDGLFNFVHADRICATARGPDLDGSARSLVDLARLRTGDFQDDITVALCRWHPASETVQDPMEAK